MLAVRDAHLHWPQAGEIELGAKFYLAGSAALALQPQPPDEWNPTNQKRQVALALLLQ
jgi:hypothetical protein